MGKKSGLDARQRRDIVLMLLRREEPMATLARRYGVSETTLHRWREDFLAAGEGALAYGRGRKANSAQWATRRRGTAAARKALRLAVRRLNVGLPDGAERPNIPQLPFDELRTRKAALAAARGDEADLLAACRASIETPLTDSQKGLWSTIRGNPATAVEYACAPGVTKAQLTALSLARAKAARRRAAAESGTAGTQTSASSVEPGGPAAGWQVSVGDIFTPAQCAAIAAARENIRRHTPGLTAACSAPLGVS